MSGSFEPADLPEVLRAAIAAYLAHDADRLETLYAADSVFESPLLVLHGAGEIAELWRAWFAAFPDVSSVFHRATVDGEVTTLGWTETATHTGELSLGPLRQAPTGRHLTWTGQTTYRINDNRIAAVHYDMDPTPLLAVVQS
jgi:ketosteroid isomerase-like protein